MEKTIGILDEEYEYAEALAAYINRKRSMGLRAIPFKDKGELKSYYANGSVDKLLIGETFSKKDINAVFLHEETEKIILVGEKTTESVRNGTRVLFKYVPAGKLTEEIIGYETPAEVQSENIYSVFSPDSAILAGVKAYELASALGKTGRTLLLSWEPFGGLGRKEHDEGKMSLSELLYILRKGEKVGPEVFKNVCKAGNVDYFCGIDYASDLWQFSFEEMKKLLSFCKEVGRYVYIIIAIGYYNDTMEKVMESCEKVYMVGVSGKAGDERMEEFRRQMKYAGRGNLLNIISEEDKIRVKTGGGE